MIVGVDVVVVVAVAVAVAVVVVVVAVAVVVVVVVVVVAVAVLVLVLVLAPSLVHRSHAPLWQLRIPLVVKMKDELHLCLNLADMARVYGGTWRIIPGLVGK